ncbi:MAG: class I SAM-dependent methyltransferase [Alphaproteobacteria bacterium]
MGFYNKHILPRLVDFGCGTSPVRRQRAKIVPRAEGRVLEIGLGSGLNLAHYDAARVERVIGLEPAGEMLARARKRIAEAPFAVECLELEGENIPLERASVDTVLVTYTLCTIPGVEAALGQMRRVLRPGGRLLFCEHGVAPDESVRRWQRRIGPPWRRAFGGCRLDRDIPALLRGAGFEIEDMETMYLPNSPRFAGFNYWGAATAKRAV